MIEEVFVFPCSFAQHRIWFIDQLEPGTALYNIPGAIRLQGKVDEAALEQSLNEIIRRHETLRTRFEVLDGEPMQVILPALAIEMPVRDLRGETDANVDHEAIRLATEDARQPFDLTVAPLLRVSLLRLRDDDYVLTLIMHHIVSDGWSVGILIKELASLYEAFINRRASPLPELPIQYADFAHWEQAWMQGDVLSEQLSYWEQKLAGELPVLELPADRQRPRVPSHRGSQHHFKLPAALTGSLKALARDEQATLFMTLLAVFKVLLYRYTGQEDVVVGVPNANRNQLETEALIGFFVNTVVLRTDLSGAPSFRQLLRRVRETVLESDAHREVPFEKLVERLQPERNLSQTPLFQIMFVFQNGQLSSLELPDLTLRLQEIEAATAKFDLILSLHETNEGLAGSLQYSTDLFDQQTVERLTSHYCNLLAAVVADSEQSISALPVLAPAEMHQLLCAWNETDAGPVSQQCLHELFASQAERTPESVAVVAEDGQLTYRELQERANQLAHYLQRLGVGPETLVGVMMERGTAVVIALMAVLKAGGAYVPLDPAYPHERLGFMMSDSRVSVLLTEQRLYERVLSSQMSPAGNGQELSPDTPRIVFCEALGESCARGETTNPSVSVTSQNLAYIIYTSGSTGRPKGIAIEHRSAVAMVHWAQRAFAASHLAGVLASTSLCFDLSIFELFVPLTMGGKVIVAENALQLPELKCANEVTLINTVPSAMTELLQLMKIPESVKVVNLAGEALSQALVDQVYAQTSAEEVWNLYGPSEDTTYSTYAMIPRASQRAPAIGRPIDNSQAYVLDPFMHPVPVGVSGELYLGGAGLARGYYGQAGLTAERFVPDPWTPGGRLYRTGDVARYSGSGELEYLGRLDQQVKLRGYRIELGEIEAVLREDERVVESVVVAVGGVGGEQQLAAYVVGREGPGQDGGAGLVAELRRKLEQRLPHYMVPGWLEVLAELPQTPNGKVDRRALPAPGGRAGGLAGGEERALTAVEEVVAGVWCEVLAVNRVGAEEDFFALGGHSLLATRVVSRLREIFNVEVPLRQMFEHSTVAGLSRSIELAQSNGRRWQLPPIERVGRDGQVPLSFSQRRLWFLDELEPGSPSYNLSSALHIEGPLNVAALNQAFDEIVRRHEALRTTFVAVDGRPVQVIAPERSLHLPIVDLEKTDAFERESKVQRLADEESQLPFDLASGPLLRARLLRLSPESHIALLTMHHIVSDGWSKGVLLREIATLYQAFCANQPSPLPELSIQYADYSYWQREWLKGEPLERHLSYWTTQLTGAPTVLELPTDFPRPAIQTFRGLTHHFDLASDLSGQLKALSRREGATLFMTLLTAWSLLLSRYTRQEDLIIGTAIANRDQSATEDLIGMFVNTLPMRVDLSEASRFTELLERVREMSLGAYAHQALPFERLIDELHLDRDTSRSPLVQVMLILQNAPANRLEIPGLTFTSIPSESKTAKLDLILSITEDAGTLHCALEYNTDLFKPSTVERLAGHFQTVLESVVAEPQRQLSQLQILTAVEQEQLRTWNSTGNESEQPYCIHELFEAQAERTPDAVAVSYEDTSLTYAELSRRTNRLARHLRTLGVGPEVRVGICVERCAEMVVGLLAILKAGGAYVPMDVDYPRERLSFMLTDARVGVLLTKAALLSSLPVHQAHTICLDTDWGVVAQQSDAKLQSDGKPENLAYVIYTSGSTGKPKGVMVSHGSVAHLFAAIYPKLGLGTREVWTLFHSYAFDFSVWEMWGPLLHGGQLVILPLWTTRTPEAFYELLKTSQVTVLSQTPSAFGQLLASSHGTAIFGGELSLRLLMLGGEALPAELGHELSKTDLPVWNFYGPTEAAVWSVIHRLDRNCELPHSIGRPIPNMQSHILDRDGMPVPVGVAGELHLSGAGLARGYLHRPDLTAEKFIPHAWGEAGARLYSTGDLTRYLPDGRIEYLGRIDQQLKLRGHRVEPGEIEAALCEQSPVREAVVVSSAAPGGDRLVAYVVADEEQQLVIQAMRDALKERLPAYMIPAAFVVLKELPLTPNGKLDRRALAAAGGESPEPERPFAPAETPAELALSRAWARVLGVKRISIHDNFFDLGGDSIRCIQARAETQKQGYDFSVQQLFQHQTVFDLAGQLRPFDAGAPAELLTPPFSLLVDADRERLPELVEDAYPLGKLQQGMLFHSELSPDTSVYHDIVSFNLRAPFEPQALKLALRELADRHAVLRTQFDLVTFGEPLQLVLKSVEVPLACVDLRHLPAAAQQDQLAAWIEAEKQNHFDWANPPYARFGVFRCSDETFQFALSFHHAILDGWSLATLLTELFTSYSGLLPGAEKSASLPPPRLAYRDFIALERQAIESWECRNYWNDKLAGSVATTWPEPDPLQADPADARSHESHFAPDFVEKLRAFARVAGVSLKSVLLAAHLKVLSLVSGRSEVLTGLVANGRPEGTDGERVLGLFLNTVPLSICLSGGTWIDLAKSARDAEEEMFPFRRYPLAELQKANGGRPLFEITFNFTHFHAVDALRGFSNLEVLGADAYGRTNFPVGISFTLDPGSSRLSLHLTSHEGKADEERLRQAAAYFSRVLEAMTDQPMARYETFSPLSPPELRLLQVEWNDTKSDYPRALCLHQMFEGQAELRPEATAITIEDQRLTYRELNERANQLAHYLQTLGVGPEVPVGILMERSLEMAIALLAVLKAGGAYVPLDPIYPAPRLSFMLNDSQAQVVLTQEHLGELLRPVLNDYAGEVVAIDTRWPVIAAESREQPASGVTAENLVYVIYTSGSTGQPKGAMLSHRGIVNCVVWMQETYRLNESDRFLLKTSLNFDPSVWEFFWTLSAGAQVIMASPGQQADTAYLIETIARHEITSAYFVPSMLRLFLDDPQASSATSLKRVICGGEKLPRETTALFFSTLSAELHHSYGPTETSIAATEWKCERERPGRPVTIGRPLANTEIHLLDLNLQPVPVGVAGELFIGGECLGRGYLHRPDLSAEKFVPHPFSEVPGARLYRTGDLVRYWRNGEIEFLGRVDQQVKVHGYRIEPGEIEASLRQHREVKDCLVLVRGETDDKQLIAYVVAAAAGVAKTGDGLVDSAGLRRHLKERLPGYMIPSAIIMLDQLPVMPNGKVDHSALPALGPDRFDTSARYLPPRTMVEEIIAGVWQDLLKVERIGVDVDFFELGGHSLLATQAVSRLRNAFRAEIPLARIFEYPTVESLAAYLVSQPSEAREFIAPPLVPVPRGDELEASFAQHRLWFLNQLDPDSSAFNIPVVLRLTGKLNVAALEQTLAEVVRRHEVLRTVFGTVAGRVVQLVRPPQTLLLPFSDLSGLPDGERESKLQRLARDEARGAFNLRRGPLVRASLLGLGPEEHVLLLTMHHIVCDAWSVGVLVRETVALYQSFSANLPSPLPELSIQYADFAVWQKRWLEGEILEKQLTYWRRQLGSGLPALNFADDKDRSSLPTFRGTAHAFSLPAALAEALKGLSRRQGVTLFMSLLAAFKLLLFHQTEQLDVLVGVNVAGRTRIETEGLIGFFVNMLALRTDLSGDPKFSELLARVRTTALGGYAHQDVAFEQLLEELNVEREWGRSPLQVAFTFDNTPHESIELPGLSLKLVDVEMETTRLDLVLALSDGPQGLRGSFQYNTDLFSASRIAGMAEHYRLLLGLIAERPDANLSSLRHALAETDELQQAARQREFKQARSRSLHNIRLKHLGSEPAEGELVI